MRIFYKTNKKIHNIPVDLAGFPIPNAPIDN